MNSFSLYEDELLDNTHMPVLMVMNMVSESRFLSVLRDISKGIGFGEEYGACTLPDDLDEFYYYLKTICNKYIEKNPEHEDRVNGFLADYSNKFLI